MVVKLVRLVHVLVSLLHAHSTGAFEWSNLRRSFDGYGSHGFMTWVHSNDLVGCRTKRDWTFSVETNWVGTFGTETGSSFGGRKSAPKVYTKDEFAAGKLCAQAVTKRV